MRFTGCVESIADLAEETLRGQDLAHDGFAARQPPHANLRGLDQPEVALPLTQMVFEEGAIRRDALVQQFIHRMQGLRQVPAEDPFPNLRFHGFILGDEDLQLIAQDGLALVIGLGEFGGLHVDPMLDLLAAQTKFGRDLLQQAPVGELIQEGAAAAALGSDQGGGRGVGICGRGCQVHEQVEEAALASVERSSQRRSRHVDTDGFEQREGAFGMIAGLAVVAGVALQFRQRGKRFGGVFA